MRGAILVAATTVLCGVAGCSTGAVVPESSAPAVVFSDDFDSGALDPGRWRASDMPDVFRVADSGLVLSLTPQQTVREIRASLSPVRDVTFSEMTFTVAVPSVTAPGPGGGSVSLRQADGRVHRIIFGPSGEGLIAGLLVCPRPGCTPDELTGPDSTMPFTPTDVVPIRVVGRGGTVEVFAKDQLLGRIDDPSPLTGFTVDVFGDDGEGWRMVVDSLRLTT